MDSQIVITPSGLLEFLNSIDELSECQLAVSETPNGDLSITVGDSIYIIECDVAADIEVEDEVVEEIDSIDQESYDDLIGEEGFEEYQPEVEGGILAEAFKGIALTGIARFVGNKLKK